MNTHRSASVVMASAIGFFAACAPEVTDPAEGDVGRASAPQHPVRSGSAGEVVLLVEVESRRAMGLRTERPVAATSGSLHVAFGKLVGDPSRSFVLRAPVAGTLRSEPGKDGPGSHWPDAGARVEGPTTVGWVEPRVTPQEHSDLLVRLTTARAELAGTEAQLPFLRATASRAEQLNADGKLVSDRALQDASSALASGEARATGARELVSALETAVDPARTMQNSWKLRIDTSGVVAELGAHPGESVEAGADLLRIEDDSVLLARIELPLDGSIPPDAGRARIEPVGAPGRSWIAERTAAPVVGDSIAPIAYFRVDLGAADARNWLRPGQSVTARIEIDANPRRTWLLPDSTIVRYAGKTWAYAQVDETHFARLEVPSSAWTGSAWAVADVLPWSGALEVVVAGAEQLLSSEWSANGAAGGSGE